MKTDLSFWTNKFSGIKVLPCKYLVYDSHPYRIQCSIAGASVLILKNTTRKEHNITAEFARLRGVIGRIRTGQKNGLVYFNNNAWLKVDLDWKVLSEVNDMLIKYPDVKMRTGGWFMDQTIFPPEPTGNKVFFSSPNIKDLEQMSIALDNLSITTYSIMAPESTEALDLLMKGNRLVKKRKTTHKFQIKLRGWTKNASSILHQLVAIGEDVYIPPATVNRLSGTDSFRIVGNGENKLVDGLSIYASDPSKLMFITLIEPKLLGKIIPLEDEPT